MRYIANKEIYRLNIKIGVDGDGEAKKKLTATERMAEQTKNRIKILDKIRANPSAKLKDNASSAIDKINSKANGLSKAVISPTAKLNDQATSKLNKISTTIKELDNASITANLKIKDQTSTHLNKVHAKSDKLKNTDINPTAKIADQASDKLEKIKKTEERLKDRNLKVQAQDEATKTLDKIENKANRLNNKNARTKINADNKTNQVIEEVKTQTEKLSNSNHKIKIKAQDEASGTINKIGSATEKLNNKNTKLKIDADNKASKVIEEVKSKSDKLNNSTSKIKIKAEDEATKTINSIESKINGWIKAGAKKIISIGVAGVLATGGIGLGTSIKTFSAYEQGLSNVKAVTDATDAQMKQLGDTAKSLGASTAWSAVQVTQAEELLGQAGFSVQETITALPGLLSLASAGSLDLAAATDIASGTLRAFSLNASQSGHVADVLALSASATNSDVTDLGETMKYVAPVSASLGISLEDTAAAAGLLSNQNIKGSQAGTVLRQAMARLASPTKEAASVMKEYGLNAFDAKGNMKPLSGVVDNLNKSLGKLTSQQRADAISTIFGTESMSGILALMNQGGQSLSDLSKRLKDAKGAANEMAETKLDNLAGQWEQLTGAVETMQVNLGERLAPYAKEFVTWLTGKMPEIENKIVSIVDYLSKHTEEIKSLAVTVVGLGTAFAGLSVIGSLGNTITGIASLVSILKGAKVAEETAAIAGGLKNIGMLGQALPVLLSPAGLAIAGVAVVAGTAIAATNNLMKKSISTTTEELGPVEKIMNKLTGSVLKSKKELMDLGIVYDDFGDGVSGNFKKAAQDASKSLLEIEMNIKKLTLNKAMSESDVSQFKNYIGNFANESINAMREKQSQIKSEFEKTFSLDGVTSDAEKGVMDYLSSYFEEGVNKEISIRDEIYKFGNDKIKEHGTLLDSDMQQIRDKLAELQAIKLEYANAESAGEAAYSRSKFESKAERVTGVKGASELLQERAKERQSKTDETKANYDYTISKIQYKMDHESNMDKKAILQKGLDETIAARDKALKQAEDDWQSDLATVYKYYPEAKGKINKNDGTQFTDGDIRSQNSLEKMQSKYKGLSNVTGEGFYGIEDAEGKMNNLYVTVDKVTGEINGAWNYTTGEVGGYTSEIKQKVQELGTEHMATSGATIQSLISMGASYNTTSGKIVSSCGDVIGELQSVTVATDNTRTGILNLNGKPILITSNAEGQIINMRSLTDATNSIPPTADIQINDNAPSATVGVNTYGDAVRNIPSEKTTIFKRIIQTVEEFFGFGGNSEPTQKAIGTSFSQEGFSTVNERGWELSQNKSVPIVGGYNGDPLTYMSRGTKILNHMQSVQDMKEEVSRQINEKIDNQPKQIQYQLIKPQQQIQIAGVGGVNFGDIKVTVDKNQDVDNIVTQAAQEFARKLRESLVNIKK